MEQKEKIIAYTWAGSLLIIVAIGFFLCSQRPSAAIIKANETIITMSERIRRSYQNRPDYWGLNTNEVIKQNLYEGTINNNRIFNNLEKQVIVGADIDGSSVMPGGRSFMIGFLELDRKECLQLASFRWTEGDNLGLLSLSILNDKGRHDFSWGDNGLPIERSRAKQYCEDKNSLMWFFE